MQVRYLRLSALIVLLLSSATIVAMPFDTFDPRSMAMGGTGVAVGDPSTAPFFNPAMLTTSDQSKNFSIELPIIGVRLYDPGNLHNNLNSLSDDINALSNSITTVNNNSSSTSASVISQVPANMTTVANNIDKVNSLLSSLNNQPIQAQFGAATVVGIPGKNWGFAWYADVWGAMGGSLQYNDATTLSNLSADTKTAANVLSGTTAVANNPTAQAACAAVLAGTGSAQNVTDCVNYAKGLKNLSGALSAASQSLNFSTNTQIASKVRVRGVLIEESGLSVSHQLVTSDQTWSLGFTPKVMNLTLFDATLSANNGTSTSNMTGNDYIAKYNTVNFDMGVAKSYNNGWRTGVVVKNVVPQTFDFKNAPTSGATPVADGNTLTMNPQARFGASHENSWSTVAFDMDITKNNPAGLENASQYMGIGGELSAWGWTQFRAGYRSDLLSAGKETISLGFGLSPRIPYFKPHLDLGISASPDVLSNGWNNATQVGASIKAGFNF